MMGVETNGKLGQSKNSKPNGHTTPRPLRTSKPQSGFMIRSLSLVARSVMSEKGAR